MAEEHTEGAQPGAQSTRYISVGEAAKLLGVHRNTVHHRIKAGRIKAHKVIEAEREVYRIERDSLDLEDVGRTELEKRTLGTTRRTTVGQDLVQALMDRIEEVSREHAIEVGDIREQLGEERVRRQYAEERAAAAEQEAQRLQGELEAERSKGFRRRVLRRLLGG